MSRQTSSLATLEGVRPVIEAIRAGRRRVLEVRLPPGARATPGLRELREVAGAAGVPLREIEGDGVTARAEPLPEPAFETLLAALEPPRRLLALDRVTDVGNLGSLARSAEAAGVGALLLELRHAPPLNAGALRASAGALEHLPVGRTPSLPGALELARAEGLRVLVADAGAPPLEALPPGWLRGEWVLVLGSEDRGPRARVERLADARVGIPMEGRIASLGVAAAGAHLLLRLAELRRGA